MRSAFSRNLPLFFLNDWEFPQLYDMSKQSGFLSYCEGDTHHKFLKDRNFEERANFIFEIVAVPMYEEMYDFCGGQQLTAKQLQLRFQSAEM